MKILLVCTGNTCRSQMAVSILRDLLPGVEICSGGTHPGQAVNPYAIRALLEAGLDAGNSKPESISRFAGGEFDYVVVLCENALALFPDFGVITPNLIYIPLPDPYNAEGTEMQILEVYRAVRDQLRQKLRDFANAIRPPV